MELTGLRALADEFDDFLVDLWGTIHDGETLYEGVIEALEQLAAVGGKRVLFLTNTSRAGEVVLESLLTMGIERTLFFGVLSSGDVTRAALAARDASVFARLAPHRKPRCFHEGDASFVPWLFELGFDMVSDAAEADFVVATGAPRGIAGLASSRLRLAGALARDVPLVGTNPDRRIPNAAGELLGPGAIAADYASRGGRVFLFGKPHRPIYEAAQRRLAGGTRRIVAIGDLAETDVRGARAVGLASVLITHDRRPDAFAIEETPDWLLPRVRW